MTAGRQERGEITPNAQRMVCAIAKAIADEVHVEPMHVAEILQALEAIRYRLTEDHVRSLPRT